MPVLSFVVWFCVSSKGFMFRRKVSWFRHMVHPVEFILDQQHQFTHAHVERSSDAPECFHVGVLAAILNHRQMTPCDACQSRQNLLRHLALYPDAPDDLPNNPVIVIHTQSPFLIGVAIIRGLVIFADSRLPRLAHSGPVSGLWLFLGTSSRTRVKPRRGATCRVCGQEESRQRFCQRSQTKKTGGVVIMYAGIAQRTEDAS